MTGISVQIKCTLFLLYTVIVYIGENVARQLDFIKTDCFSRNSQTTTTGLMSSTFSIYSFTRPNDVIAYFISKAKLSPRFNSDH